MAQVKVEDLNADVQKKQTPKVTWEDYARAEKFLPQNIGKLVSRLQIVPNWAGKGDCFWYRVDTRQGKEFMFVDPEAGLHQKAFDHAKLASQLSRATKRAYTHTHLPFDGFRYTDSSLSAISFEVDKTCWQFHLENSKLTRCPSGDTSSADSSAETAEVRSPDDKWAAFVKDYNLHIRCISTGRKFR